MKRPEGSGSPNNLGERVMFSLYLGENMLAQLRQIARDSGVSTAYVVRLAIADYLEENVLQEA